MVRDSTEQLGGEYDLESRGSDFSCTPSATGANTALPSINKCSIALELKEVVFFRGPLLCYCTVSDM